MLSQLFITIARYDRLFEFCCAALILALATDLVTSRSRSSSKEWPSG